MGKIESILAKFRDKTPGSNIVFAKKNGRFSGIFLFSYLCIEYAKNYIPIISLEAYHLKSRYQGAILMDSMMQGSGKILPISFGV
ncbi:hypothetical protein AYI68_g7331 [Smittium mucronatum]|uniref:Uncharacterized protein n=1 Tax=Smittium mucronatum TaxID=133383 RepID=A0A1R0GNZ8_9FUNG|nr:hypothetical protein AYI68_g7331 [Smittium mucronatum]